MSVLTDLAQRLEDEGVGTVGTDIFRGRTPDDPDELLRVQTFDGVTPAFAMMSTCLRMNA